MKKIAAWIIGVIVLVGSIAIGAIVIPGDVEADSATISNYDVVYDVSADGKLHVVETLTFNFPESKHGIFRFFDTRDKNNPKHRFLPENITVTRDGNSEPFEILTEQRGRIRDVKIGDADRTLTGEHVYKISYDETGTIIPGVGTPSRFYWNVIPEGWRNTIAKAHIEVNLPADVDSLTCGIGLGANPSPCQASGQGRQTVTIDTGSLAVNTPVTLSAGMALAVPSESAAGTGDDTLPWNGDLDPFLGRSPVLLGLVIVVALVMGAGGVLLSRSTKEDDPGFPLMYAPPDGIGPAEAAYILNEKVDNKAFVATLMYAAEKGAIDLNLQDKTWTATGGADTTKWTTLDDVTERTARSLGINAPGESFTAAPSSVSAGQTLKTAIATFEANATGAAKTSGLMVNAGLGGAGTVVLLGAWALTIYLGAFNPFHMSLFALIPGIFAITATSIGLSGAGTKRTPAGREMWSRIGGFYRILSTDSAQDRFDFAGRKELYTSYLPWAVAFDCADRWASKYKIETGEEPPTPHYFAGYSGFYAGSAIGSMVDSFDSSVSSAVSAYDATQSSSSSGGGGFSGGGGGGGGGGGSW